MLILPLLIWYISLNFPSLGLKIYSCFLLLSVSRDYSFMLWTCFKILMSLWNINYLLNFRDIYKSYFFKNINSYNLGHFRFQLIIYNRSLHNYPLSALLCIYILTLITSESVRILSRIRPTGAKEIGIAFHWSDDIYKMDICEQFRGKTKKTSKSV